LEQIEQLAPLADAANSFVVVYKHVWM